MTWKPYAMKARQYKRDYYRFLDDFKNLRGSEYGGPTPTVEECVEILELLERGGTQEDLNRFYGEIKERRLYQLFGYDRPRSRLHLLVAS